MSVRYKMIGGNPFFISPTIVGWVGTIYKEVYLEDSYISIFCAGNPSCGAYLALATSESHRDSVSITIGIHFVRVALSFY